MPTERHTAPILLPPQQFSCSESYLPQRWSSSVLNPWSAFLLCSKQEVCEWLSGIWSSAECNFVNFLGYGMKPPNRGSLFGKLFFDSFFLSQLVLWDQNLLETSYETTTLNSSTKLQVDVVVVIPFCFPPVSCMCLGVREWLCVFHRRGLVLTILCASVSKPADGWHVSTSKNSSSSLMPLTLWPPFNDFSQMAQRPVGDAKRGRPCVEPWQRIFITKHKWNMLHWFLPNLIWTGQDCDTPAVWRQSCSAHVRTDSTHLLSHSTQTFQSPILSIHCLITTLLPEANSVISHVILTNVSKSNHMLSAQIMRNTCLAVANVNVANMG